MNKNLVMVALGMLGVLVSATGCGDDEVLHPDPDVTPPSVIAGLTAAPYGVGSVLLTWGAPGDDGAQGTASRYDVRISTEPKQGDEWLGQLALSPPSPLAAGERESFAVTGLTGGSRHFFAIRAADEASNWSTWSPAASSTAPMGMTACAWMGIRPERGSCGVRVTRGGGWISDATVKMNGIRLSLLSVTEYGLTDVQFYPGQQIELEVTRDGEVPIRKTATIPLPPRIETPAENQPFADDQGILVRWSGGLGAQGFLIDASVGHDYRTFVGPTTRSTFLDASLTTPGNGEISVGAYTGDPSILRDYPPPPGTDGMVLVAGSVVRVLIR